MKKIFAYKNTVKITKSQIKEIEAEGYIPIQCENISDIRMIESFPDVDNTWLISTMLDLIIADDTYSGTKNKLANLILGHLKRKIAPKVAPLNG